MSATREQIEAAAKHLQDRIDVMLKRPPTVDAVHDSIAFNVIVKALPDLLASYDALSKAGEEMPSADAMLQRLVDVGADHGEETRALAIAAWHLTRPIVARLRKERDAARAELAARTAPIEPRQDMVGALAHVAKHAEDAAYKTNPHISEAELAMAGIRAVLSRLASMGTDVLPGVDIENEWIGAALDEKRNAFERGQYDGMVTQLRRIRSTVAPILAAKDASITWHRAEMTKATIELGHTGKTLEEAVRSVVKEAAAKDARIRDVAEALSRYALPEDPNALERELAVRRATVQHNRLAFEDEQRLLAGARDRVQELEAQLAGRHGCIAEPTLDSPVDDPVERACLIARELRMRGIDSRANGAYVEAKASGYRYDVRFRSRVTMPPRTIADEIQRQEAKRAQALAGDT